MAEFITKCPHCNNDLQVQDEWIGMDLECPLCHKIFAINKSSAQVETEKTEAVVNSALAADEKNCPFCGNRINAKAIRCKFCKQNLTENIITFVPNHKNNGTSVWEKLTSLPPHVRKIGVGIIILLFLAICSGIFFVWNDNYLIKAWKIEKRVQAYSSWSRECSGESFSLSPVNVTLDNMGSFFAGFFFCYGEDTFRNKNRLLDKVLYRYGKEGKNNREAIMTTMEIWYAAKKQQAENEGRYLDY